VLALAPEAWARGTGAPPPQGAIRSASAAPLPPPGVVDGEAALDLAARGIRVVDVRTPAEFAAGHVPGAVNVPFDQIAARAGDLGPPGAPLLLYCRSGRRSGIAAQELRGLGFTNVYDLRTLSAWPGEVAVGGR
jgi:rhodanese-related sulfurtransferase